jgi:hypothetical protein
MPYFPIKDHIKPMPSAHKEGPDEEMRLVRGNRGPRGRAPGPYEVARALSYVVGIMYEYTRQLKVGERGLLTAKSYE